MRWSWQHGNFVTISIATKSRSQPLSHFRTYLKIEWAMQLAEHTIDFVSRSAIKSQVLADFIADWTPATPSQEQPKIETIWQLECDGAYQRDGAGASAVLTAPSGTQLKCAVRLDFEGCTNNIA